MRRLSLTAALTWQEAEQLNVPFLLGIPPSLLGIDPTKAYTLAASSVTPVSSA